MLFRLLMAVLVLWPVPALAFDYLEHSWVSDRACRQAQLQLQPLLSGQDSALAARYLALALVCPQRWTTAYCAGEVKQVVGTINLLDAPPARSGDHAVTLGDLAALPDHLSQFGPIALLPQADRPGLTARLWQWLAADPGDAGGVVGDVAEDACETKDLVDWPSVEGDVTAWLARAPRDVSPVWLTPLQRGPATRGPSDPSGAYSFDNPHYLDLVLRNHHHFGTPAYATWTGLHAAARAVAGRTCADVLALSADDLEDLADEAALPERDWQSLPQAELHQHGCEVLRQLVKRRLQTWAQLSDPQVVQPATAWLQRAQGPDGRDLLDQTATALMGLVLEGAGLHFLQDGFSAGHLRTNRAARGLGESRHDHDADNRMGLAAVWSDREALHHTLVYGDAYLLGNSGQCHGLDLEQPGTAPPGQVTACLLRHQRGLLVATTGASLLDWALGGLLDPQRPPRCDESPAAAQACRFLPTRAPSVPGLHPGLHAHLEPGDLPVTPPPFGYQALSGTLSLDGAGRAAQVGARLQFLSELDARANWMTSWDGGLLLRLGDRGGPELSGEFGYLFHFRWAARFLLDAGPYAVTGLGGLGQDVRWFGGLGGTGRVTLLPEGWTKIPLALSLGYRFPVVLLDSRRGLDVQAPAHWIDLGVGLAFL